MHIYIENITNEIILIFLYILLTTVLCYLIFIGLTLYKIKKNIKDYEKKYDTRVIFIVDEFWMNKYIDLIKTIKNNIIDINDSSRFQDILNDVITKNIKKLDIYIQSNGGYVKDNDVIVNNLINYDGIINTYIPKFAYSAACLISLCGNNIYMNETAVLGPTDPITEIKGNSVSVQSLLKFKKQKKVKNIDETLLIQINDLEKIYNENLIILGRIFLKKHNADPNKNKNLIKIFGSGNYSHESPFTKKFLISNGLNIENNNRFYDLKNILDDIHKLKYFF